MVDVQDNLISGVSPSLFVWAGFYDKTNLSSVNMGIPVDLNVEANGTGRLETAPWSIDHIALGDAHRSGWCCY